MFEVGESVVYGNNGVCNIKSISTLDMQGIPRDRLYYQLSPNANAQEVIYAAVDNPRVVIRKVMSKDDAMTLIREAPKIELISIPNDKLREDKYKECIRSCESREWMRLIKTIYERKQGRLREGKKVTATDERYMKRAEDYLYEELSTALEIPRDEIPAFIGGQIFPENEIPGFIDGQVFGED